MKYFRIFSFILCATVLSLSGITNAADSDHEIIGIDVSKYQGTVDFGKVRDAGVSYVFIRATDGITYQDPDFERNYFAARAAGLTLGAYHFYETNDDPDAQLENYTSAVVLRPGDLPPVIDIEKLHKNDKGELKENLRKFLAGLEAHYGVKPVVYTGLRFSNKYLHEFGAYPLWIAEYEREKPELPTGWENWTFWQWSQTHTIPGIKGHVDADRYAGDRAAFQELLIK